MSNEHRHQRGALRFTLIILTALTLICTCCVGQINSYAESSSAAFAAAAPNATGQVKSKKGLYLRAKASSSSKKVVKLKYNTKVTISKEVFLKKNKTSAKYKWYYVSASGKKGYVRSDYLKNVKYSTTSGITISDLNYRTGPGTKMKKVGTFKNKSLLTVVLSANVKGNSTVWYKIKKGSKYYYVCSDWARLGVVDVVKTAVTPAAMIQPSNPAAVPDGDPSFTIKGATYPGSILEKIPFTLLGTIDSTQIIQTARVGVLDTGGNWVLYKDLSVNATKCEIVKADADIKFGTLAPGSYTYRVAVVVNGKEYMPINKSFTVRKSTGSQRLAEAAQALAWPCGTAKSTYGSKPTEAYKFALDAAYPEHNSWGTGPKTGASCDVFIGTVCDYSGVDGNLPRTLGKQWTYFSSHPEIWVKVPYHYKESELQSGDIFIYEPTSGSKHICMYLKIDGKTYCAEASYPRALYGFINTSTSKFFTSSNKKKLEVYRPNF